MKMFHCTPLPVNFKGCSEVFSMLLHRQQQLYLVCSVFRCYLLYSLKKSKSAEVLSVISLPFGFSTQPCQKLAGHNNATQITTILNYVHPTSPFFCQLWRWSSPIEWWAPMVRHKSSASSNPATTRSNPSATKVCHTLALRTSVWLWWKASPRKSAPPSPTSQSRKREMWRNREK